VPRRDEIDKEIAFHIESRIDALMAGGATREEAARLARLELGGAAQVREAVRDVHVWRAFDGLLQDVRLAIRALRATPAVSFVAVLSLALGIGANTAMFSIVNSLVLRTLPVREPQRLVELRSREPNGFPEWSYPVWDELRRRPDLFERAAAWSPIAQGNLVVDGVGEKMNGFFASGSFFDTLGVAALIGRTFGDADDRRGGGPHGPVTVISYGFWQRHFGGDPAAVGRSITFENVRYTIVGVTPPEFFGADVGRTFDAIVPLGTEPLVSRVPTPRIDSAGASWLYVIGRLRSDQTIEEAAAGVRGVRQQVLDATVPPDWPGIAGEEYRRRAFSLAPAATGESTLRTQFEQPLVTIMIVVVLVLVIACANIANLLLARASARRHDLAMRVALGASRWRLVRQLFTESVILASIGAAAGALIAAWASRFIVSQISTEVRPVYLDVSMDRAVLVFTIAIACATALLFGVAPALHASRVDPVAAMNELGNRHSAGRHARVSSGLVVAQIALSVVLVVAAGLFIRTFASLATRPLGFDRDRVLVASVNAHSAAIDPAQRLSLYARARDAARAVPAVADASISYQTPPAAMVSIIPVDAVSGAAPLQGMERMSAVNFVSAGWFSTFGMRLAAGRDVGDADRAGTPRVAVANQAFARKFLRGASPLGRTISSKVGTRTHPMSFEIVGLVDDALFGSLRRPHVDPMLYLPLVQADWLPAGFLAQVDVSVRSAGAPPAQLARSVGAAIRAVNPELVVTSRPLADQVNATLTQERVVAMLSGFFGALALLLAGLGLYGVTSYAVARRRTEIGIRMALGAAPSGVVRLVLGRVARLVAAGVIVGAGVSLWTSTFVAPLLYGLEPRDPATIGGAAVVLAAVGTIAGWVPAHRASRMDPAGVLRDA
jgi:putative ABC transport system permease protein